MNLFQLKWCWLVVFSVLVLVEVAGAIAAVDQGRLEPTMMKSLHEANAEAQLSSEMSVGVNFNGVYPYPPGATVPIGGFQIPILGRASIGPVAVVGGPVVDFNCSSILNKWAPLGVDKMFGVALYRAVVGGVAEVRGVYAYSSLTVLSPAQNPGAPHSGLDYLAHGYVGNGPIVSWKSGNPTPMHRMQHKAAIAAAFSVKRKCFATDPAIATCQLNEDGGVNRTFTNGITERGYPAGSCALSKIALQLVADDVKKEDIICAGEITPVGWSSGHTNIHPYGTVKRTAREIVSSCATCQQGVPMILSSCTIPALGATYGLGVGDQSCARAGAPGGRLLEGETCQLGCAAGYSLTTDPITYTCRNGVAVAAGAQTCTRSCALPNIAGTIDGCAGGPGAIAADGRLLVGQTCTWACLADYVGQTAAGAPGPLTQTCLANEAVIDGAPTLSPAPVCRAPCPVPIGAPPNTSPNGPLLNGGVPPRCVPQAFWGPAAVINRIIHGIGCQFSCLYGGAVIATCNNGNYGPPPPCPPPPVPEVQPADHAPLGPQGGGGLNVVGAGGPVRGGAVIRGRGGVVAIRGRGGGVGAGGVVGVPRGGGSAPRGRGGRFSQSTPSNEKERWSQLTESVYDRGMNDQRILQP